MWNDIKRIADDSENVTKFVYSNDTAVAELVLYRYPKFRDRTVICLSVQAGCPIGCRFCGAGDHFVRSLTSEEMIAQVDHCLEEAKTLEGTEPEEIKRLQLMTMAMGEPLLNLKELTVAFEKLHKRYPKAALLISTSAPKVDYQPIIELSQRIPTVGLQFSVHESTDEARNVLIPFKNKLTLAEISKMGSIWYHQVGRHPFFNYCAHDGNTSDADVNRIYDLFNPLIWCATVSVVCERSEGMTKTNAHQHSLAEDFANKLAARGYDTRMFDPSGQDSVGGGCGQLFHTQSWIKTHPELARPSIGWGKEIVHSPS